MRREEGNVQAVNARAVVATRTRESFGFMDGIDAKNMRHGYGTFVAERP
jgi:hypothetical protein